MDSQLTHKYKWRLYYRKRNKDIIFLPRSLWENHHRKLKIIQNILSSLFVFLSCSWGIWWPTSHRHPAQISPVIGVKLQVKTCLLRATRMTDWLHWLRYGVKCLKSHIVCFLVSKFLLYRWIKSMQIIWKILKGRYFSKTVIFFFTNKHYFYSTVFVKSCEIVCVCREVRMKCLLLTFSTTESALEISSLA